MLRKLTYIDAVGTDPFKNLGMEEYLLGAAALDECILYLWQNEKTVVIGRNQNPWKECQTEQLEAEGGHLARRLSGGGAVYHDLGNLNFTFLTRKENYDITRQTEVLVETVKSLGINARRTGRNDVTVEGRKISGNAYYETGDFCYQHGTLLLSADTLAMARYLTVSKEKLQSKGVDSVRSRVANLCDFVPETDQETVRERMRECFGRVYHLPVEELSASRLNWQEIDRYEKRYASREWRYGRKIPFSDSSVKRFPWGELEVLVEINRGRIEDIRISSDALDAELPGLAEVALKGGIWNKDTVKERIGTLPCRDALRREMKQAIEETLCDMI